MIIVVVVYYNACVDFVDDCFVMIWWTVCLYTGNKHAWKYIQISCIQGWIQDFHGGGGAKGYVPARIYYECGTELTFGRGAGPA